MEAEGVISKVEGPSEWCSGIMIVPKPKEKVRICVDLTNLNGAVQRELYVMPSVEESLAKLAGARVFTKLDANNGFWQVKLEEESAKLTTFITPIGRFKFNRLPYGLNSAPEYFMKHMAQALDSIEGIVCHVDDILVYGKDQKEHDCRLESTMKALEAAGITLNLSKCEFSKSQVSYLGHQITDQITIKPDPSKTKAIENMPPPSDVSGVRRFVGMLNQLGKFIPHLATITKPLRELLISANEWTWDEPQQQAFEKLKENLQSNVVLKMYDPNKETLISADSSSYGLGAVILQKQDDLWGPMAYASRALIPTEQRYAQVEKEALATTWACERFHMYVYGRAFKIETDHKPLIPLLDDIPPRILRFRLCLMKYMYEITHVPGKNSNHHHHKTQPWRETLRRR